MVRAIRLTPLDGSPATDASYRTEPAPDGREHFDDRSTAFGTAALAFSEGLSDLAAVLRYIWLRAGGADERDFLPYDADHVVLLSPTSARP